MEIRPATKGDLPAVAEIFHAAFPESVAAIYGPGRSPNLDLTASLFSVCLRTEPEAFWVACTDGDLAGYIFAPVRLSRLWQTALLHGDPFRWAWGWLTGQYGLGWRPIRIALANKLSFFRHAVADEHPTDARILSVAVHPRRQGSGIARRLCTLAVERFDRLGVERSRLEVRPGNAAAVHLYTSLGYERGGSMFDSQGEWWVMLRRKSSR